MSHTHTHTHTHPHHHPLVYGEFCGHRGLWSVSRCPQKRDTRADQREGARGPQFPRNCGMCMLRWRSSSVPGREQHWFSPKAVSGGDLDIQQTMHSQVHCRNESAVVVIDRKDRAQLSQTASITRAQRSSSSSVPLTLMTVQRI